MDYVNLDEDGRVRCKHCGDNYTHQGLVEVFWRDREDSPTGMRVLSTPTKTEILTDTERNNPSSRRQGIRIQLECEPCAQITWLYVFQHKGQTFIESEMASNEYCPPNAFREGETL